MATNIHIKIDKIPGESTDGKHKDTIDVLAWSWGMSQAGTFHSGSGGGAGKVNVQDISITKYLDSASTKLAHACLTGEHIPKAVLTLSKAGGKDPLDFLTVTLEKIMVTAVSLGSSGGEERPTENVTLNFAKFKTEYFKQDEKGTGKADGNVGFDIAANKPV
jgi:type VI secretion system secreted protein Hcp